MARTEPRAPRRSALHPRLRPAPPSRLWGAVKTAGLVALVALAFVAVAAAIGVAPSPLLLLGGG